MKTKDLFTKDDFKKLKCGLGLTKKESSFQKELNDSRVFNSGCFAMCERCTKKYS